MTTRKPSDPDTGPKKDAAVVPTDELALPHERDAESGNIATAPDPTIQQAKKDLDQGQVDTDLWGTAGLDHQRRERLVPDVRGEPSKPDPGADSAPSTPPDKPAGS